MRYTNLGRLDINLLLVFDALLEQRSVTSAARSLGLTQAGVSHALARLRQSLGDQLFVRTKHGMQPTPRALSLAAPLSDALVRLNLALSPSDFDPSRSTETFRLLASDYFATLVLPGLIRRLQREAPLIDVRVVPNSYGDVSELIKNNEIHFAAGLFKNRMSGSLGRHCDVLTLFDDSYVCVMRKDHPLAEKQMSKKAYLACNHILFSPTGNAEFGVERYLRPLGIRRHISLITCHYLAAPAIVQDSDLVLTISSRIAGLYVDKFGLHMKPLPFKLPSTPVQLVWNSRFNSYPPYSWFRSLILDLCV
jgi:DNA-binding transcriptional LysR family regulator